MFEENKARPLDKREIDKMAAEIAEELGEKELTDGEKLILAMIIARETKTPLSYENCGKLVGLTKNGVKLVEKNALKKLERELKKAGLDRRDAEF